MFPSVTVTSPNTRLAAHHVRQNRFAVSPIWITLLKIAEIKGGNYGENS